MIYLIYHLVYKYSLVWTVGNLAPGIQQRQTKGIPGLETLPAQKEAQMFESPSNVKLQQGLCRRGSHWVHSPISTVDEQVTWPVVTR